MSLRNNPSFAHSESGITRFPPNVEQITIGRESTRVWLITRRNDVELKFPLTRDDCHHLSALLSSAGKICLLFKRAKLREADDT
jgi:hypothetical protein